jgi:4-hydroxy-tetrahydrodipicolinate reductase
MHTRIAVVGAAGRMGRAIVRAIVDQADETVAPQLVAAVDRPGAPELGQDAGTLAGVASLGVTVSDSMPAARVADVWIDFSAPDVAVAHTSAAAGAKASIVIGTTGLTAADKETIAKTAQTIPVLLAPNMSVGVNVLCNLVATAVQALGPAYDIEILETHHRGKRDAPSGTALRLGEVAAQAAGRNWDEAARYTRHGDIGPRTSQEIGVQTLRGGDVAGDHTVFFFGPGERIELTHRASTRDTFARGAVRAALWIAKQPPGLYDMGAVLGLGQR